MTTLLIIVGVLGALVLLARTAIARGRTSGWLERQVMSVLVYLSRELATPAARIATPDAKPRDTTRPVFEALDDGTFRMELILADSRDYLHEGKGHWYVGPYDTHETFNTYLPDAFTDTGLGTPPTGRVLVTVRPLDAKRADT